MDTKTLADLEAKLLEDLPPAGKRQVGELVSKYAADPSGFGMSNARAALLQLAEDGKIALDESGNVSRRK